MSKFFDFDAMVQEQEKQPVVIKIFGEEEELPSSLPAKIILQVVRLNREGAETFTEEHMVDMAHAIFGEERFNKWLEKGLTINQLEPLIQNTIELYMDNTDRLNEGGNSTKTP